VSLERLLLVFKREPYFMFSKHFPESPLKGYGVVNNKKITHWCASQGILLAVMFKDGGCYMADAMEFYLFYEKYGTDVSACPGEIAAPLAMFEAVY
jgi:hypothetical protein